MIRWAIVVLPLPAVAVVDAGQRESLAVAWRAVWSSRPLVWAALPTLSTLQKGNVQGMVIALAVLGRSRHPQLPDVLTIAESGVPGYEVTSWQGMCAPAAVPKPLLAKLNADLVKVLNMPDTQQRLAEQGVDAAPTTPEQFASHIRSEIIKWAKVVKEAGITAE